MQARAAKNSIDILKTKKNGVDGRGLYKSLLSPKPPNSPKIGELLNIENNGKKNGKRNNKKSRDMYNSEFTSGDFAAI